METPRPWRKIFTHISDQKLDSNLRSNWYKIIHGRILHNEMLHRQKRRATPFCDVCPGAVENIQHKIFECKVVRAVWNYTRSKIETTNSFLKGKSNESYLYPVSREFPIAIKRTLAKYLYFVCNTTHSEINIQNFSLYVLG